MRVQHHPATTQQQGAVLVVSLMLLIVMTLIGVTAMRTTTLEEKMSGNTRDNMLAFNAAEVALLDAENWTANTLNALAAAFNGANAGLYAQGSDPNILAAATWTAANSIPYGGPAYPNVATQPRYIIELMGVAGESGDDLSVVSYDETNQSGTPYAFRITARGTGGSNNATVLLQSNYIRVF